MGGKGEGEGTSQDDDNEFSLCSALLNNGLGVKHLAYPRQRRFGWIGFGLDSLGAFDGYQSARHVLEGPKRLALVLYYVLCEDTAISRGFWEERYHG